LERLKFEISFDFISNFIHFDLILILFPTLSIFWLKTEFADYE